MVLAQRINMILKASLGNLLDRAENPEKMLGLYRHELEEILAEIQLQRSRIEGEISHLESRPEPGPGVGEEILALRMRETDLAESMAAVSVRLGQVQGRILVARNRKVAPNKQTSPEQADTRPFPDTGAFDQAVQRFESRSRCLERQFLELESA